MEHRIRQYRLEQGALEVEYMEQMFTEFEGGKKAVFEKQPAQPVQ